MFAREPSKTVADGTLIAGKHSTTGNIANFYGTAKVRTHVPVYFLRFTQPMGTTS